jgi:hypothetical protein
MLFRSLGCNGTWCTCGVRWIVLMALPCSCVRDPVLVECDVSERRADRPHVIVFPKSVAGPNFQRVPRKG